MHKDHKVYVPELIFGNLLTSSNYDDGERKVTGGRNGYGAKLANIFSSKFTVETVDSRQGLRYHQVFSANMSSKEDPEITSVGKCKRGSGDFTRITFSPDLARFNMDCLDEDTVALMTKRVYDMAGITDASVAVYMNGSRLPVRRFSEYVDMFVEEGDAPRVFERVNDRWEVCVTLSDGQFQQVSFANAICTIKGGQHVDYITDQIAKEVVKAANKKNKGVQIKPHHVKNHLFVFVNALIENPAFDSQTKETLTTRSKAFGSTAELSAKYLKAITKTGLVDRVLSWAKFKQTTELKKVGGSKKVSLRGIPKLNDANWAGSTKSSNCTLILTEGDSAMSLAVSGLSVVGRDAYGVFPLKGKPLNVREATHQSIMGNAEISNIVKIMGLQFGKEYTSTKGLRYGHLLIMADQDHDGSHIKGLILNLLAHFWPTLLQIPGFLRQFITPIVKCSKGKHALTFFTVPEYLTWKEATQGGKGWGIKYYKGLGTSSASEAKLYFSNLDTHVIDFGVTEADDTAALDLAFNKKRADDRKDWLLSMRPGTFVNYAVPVMPVRDFVNKELILFSAADNIRSIPSAVDGLKPAQRKVLFACFKRNLVKQEIKVAQLAGYVSEHAAYHHGEASLAATIVSMAQNFVGSNNVNLMVPSGQFGTRRMGGKDASSARYIFTKLAPIARALFHADDDSLLDYQFEDGQRIEPNWYAPIIPLVLVNGSDGIGTGWSSFVPNHDPRLIIDNVRAMLDSKPLAPMAPWYRGFSGSIAGQAPKGSSADAQTLLAAGDTSGITWSIKGSVEIVSGGDDEDDGASVATGAGSASGTAPSTMLRITELPVRKWTEDYKQMLESMMPGAEKEAAKGGKGGKRPPAIAAKKKATEEAVSLVKSFKENHTDTTVDFTVELTPEGAAAHGTACALAKAFKLEAKMTTTNMHLFDSDGRIKKYESPEQLLRDFFSLRMVMYAKRKAALLAALSGEWERLDNRARFILEVVKGTFKVSNVPKATLLQQLADRGYSMFDPSAGKASAGVDAEGGSGAAEEEEEAAASKVLTPSRGYNYLLSMPLWSLTEEKVAELTAELEAKEAALVELRATEPSDLWRRDLDALEVALDAADADTAEELEVEGKARRKYQRSMGAAQKKGKGKKGSPAAAAVLAVDARAGAAARIAAAKEALQSVGAELTPALVAADEGTGSGDWDDSDEDSDFEFSTGRAKAARGGGSSRAPRHPASVTSSTSSRAPVGGATAPVEAKPKATSAAAVSSKVTKASRPPVAPKQRPKAAVVISIDSDSDDDDMMTLAQRLAVRAAASPDSAAPAPQPQALKAVAAQYLSDEAGTVVSSKPARGAGKLRGGKVEVAPTVVDSDSGLSDDEFGFNDESDTAVTPPKKGAPKRAPAKAKAASKAIAPTAQKRGAQKRGKSAEREAAAGSAPEASAAGPPASPMAPSPAPKRGRKAPAKSKSTLAAAAPAVAAAASDSDDVVTTTVAPARKGRAAARRAAAAVTKYVDSEAEDEDEEGFSAASDDSVEEFSDEEYAA
jgi:DNA topoisomerase-2